MFLCVPNDLAKGEAASIILNNDVTIVSTRRHMNSWLDGFAKLHSFKFIGDQVLFSGKMLEPPNYLGNYLDFFTIILPKVIPIRKLLILFHQFYDNDQDISTFLSFIQLIRYITASKILVTVYRRIAMVCNYRCESLKHSHQSK